ncbi:hypothetical protein HUZ36_04015 [Pseudoalteromonas sp. McH1-7]|nr:hypothetical protein [Pseudoalteromonas sp. McH1-7]NUZ09936.1 hypothetical protein [Pseudoalteromonas sp. McH1-7]
MVMLCVGASLSRILVEGSPCKTDPTGGVFEELPSGHVMCRGEFTPYSY